MSATVSDKVVALPGYQIFRCQSEPISEVVAIAEDILAMAKTGKLRGIGAALVLADPQFVTDTRLFSGPSPDRYVLIAAVAHLRHLTDETAWPHREVQPNDVS